MPFFLFAVRTISDNKKSIIRLKHIIGEIDEQWQDIISGVEPHDQLLQLSNSVQHGIYLNRKESPLIFDFIYQRTRSEYESTMNRSAHELVQEYQKART